MTAWRLVRFDLRLQLRYGYYAAYIFVAVAYIALLRLLPSGPRALALPPMLLSEASIIGFFFAGTLLHLERTEGTLQALAVTPLPTATYLFAKMGSLSLLAAMVAVSIVWGVTATTSGTPLLAASAALTAAMFVAVGLAAAARFGSLERFAVWGGLGSSVFALPLLPYFGVMESPLWWAVPTQPALVLLARALGAGRVDPPTPVVLALLAGWVLLAFVAAQYCLERTAFQRQRSGTWAP